jgi:hypothetical protein
LSLIRVGDATNTNLVPNPGFETGTGNQASNWSNLDFTGGKFPATGYVRSTSGIAAPRSGSYAQTIHNLDCRPDGWRLTTSA